MKNELVSSNIFFIDTSGLVRIFRFYPVDLIDPIWDELKELFIKEKLFSHRFVYDEITTNSKKPDLLSVRIKPFRQYFRNISIEQAKIVSRIIQKFPGLIDPKNEKEQADPWLIAESIIEQNQLSIFSRNKKVFVVSEESEYRSNRIPQVCNHFGISHLNLSNFYQLNKWSFKLIT